MPTTINTNMASLSAQRALQSTNGSLSTSMQRLSTGLRINSAKDDAAGLAIAERMTSQVRGMSVASRNANDAISMSQTAEGALGKVGESLQRMRELAVQSRNGSNSTTDQENLDKEYQSLAEEVTRIVDGTKFNGKELLKAGAAKDTDFQVGAGTTTEDTLTIEFEAEVANTVATKLSAVTTTDIKTDDAKTKTAIDDLDLMINDVTEARSYIGAQQSKFENVVSNLSVASENVSAARGRIVDADFAVESANLSRAQVLAQAGNTMLAQANQQPQQVMSLLR
ncbi:flagellin FliC [Sphaerotilus natans subsp. natans DSM 6575]|uniref:Flagellin n=1 Tax=Sphaerotilus natans subsp. natans DSM 6575 TaxID=1286631 RepID=A0A059KM66_9BURK|nr:flagellin [Sphaerotilus natans]KDB52319.1 flagellin FliC [Sphaerotilus natans subsp. natans DSM 6575]SIS06280.1 flagellin [Sphaerotilus natans]